MNEIDVVYVVEYYSATKKHETLPFASTQMDLEGIMLGCSANKFGHRQIPRDFT